MLAFNDKQAASFPICQETFYWQWYLMEWPIPDIHILHLLKRCLILLDVSFYICILFLNFIHEIIPCKWSCWFCIQNSLIFPYFIMSFPVVKRGLQGQPPYFSIRVFISIFTGRWFYTIKVNTEGLL